MKGVLKVKGTPVKSTVLYITKQMGATAWDSYYDQGMMKAVMNGPGSAIIQLNGVLLPHRAICMRILGWMEKFVDLASNKKAVILHARCTLKGDPLEEWIGRW
jgi:hypothetical protein